MSKLSRALTEVWEWKEKIYEERKDMTLAEWAKMSKQSSNQIREEYGLGKESEARGKVKR